MSAFREAIEICLRKNLLFVAFRRNNGLHLWVSGDPYLKEIPWVELERCRSVFVVSPFRLGDKCQLLVPKLQWGPDAPFDPADLAQMRSFDPVNRPDPIQWDKKGHTAAIKKLHQRMAEGPLEKVVLSRTMRITLEKAILPELFFQAIEEDDQAFICLLHSAEYGTWIGASPEQLIAASREEIHLDSLAGTLPLDQAPDDPADWGWKETEEQELVTKGIIGTFKALGADQIEVVGPSVLRTRYAAHLYSRLSVERKRTTLARIVRKLHPTPAVCGTPKELAMAAMQEFEPHDRELYAGFWGPWQVDGLTNLYVNIRCMRVENDHAVLFAGGGITLDSDPEREWAETEQKAEAWLGPLRTLQARIS